MSLIKVQTVLERTSALPEDRVVMDMYFGTGPADQSLVTVALIEAALLDFWQGSRTTALSLSGYLATDVSRGVLSAHRRYYGKEPGEADFGSPLIVNGWTPGAPPSATGLPDEACVCLSYHGDLTDISEEDGATRPASRRRGRIYFGPLYAGAVSTGAGLPTRPLGALVSDLLDAADDLLAASEAAATWSWVCAHASGTAGWSVVPVVGGWVDNAWDTQRRRGMSATTRQTFS